MTHFAFRILDCRFLIDLMTPNPISQSKSKISAGVLLHNDEKWEG
jgi:hypothetical protein